MPSLTSVLVRASTAATVVATIWTIGSGVALAQPTVETTPTTEPIPLTTCPIDGTSNFTDSWGDRRSGGRSHEGVDMAAPRGTPVVAVRSGDAELKRSNLGGNAVWLTTPTGDRYYYAHLDSYQGASRTVAAGEVIGYVGSTGNARGNHLHFETRVGDTANNPYPAVAAACIEPTPRRAIPKNIR